jgi:hypothetical protein
LVYLKNLPEARAKPENCLSRLECKQLSAF